MKIIIAPQSFKGSLSAKEATKIIYKSAEEIFPKANLVGIPIADGGDGTLETIVDATDGKLINSVVTGPDGSKVKAEWGLFISEKKEKTAIIEMARASGLAMLDPNNLNPFTSTTFGTGELIINAIEKILKSKKVLGQIINIGSGKPIKVRSVIEKINILIKKGKPEFGKIAMRKEEFIKYYPDINKAKKLIGWKPKKNFYLHLNY